MPADLLAGVTRHAGCPSILAGSTSAGTQLSDCSFPSELCFPAPTSADQVDRGAQFQQRVVGRLDARQTWDGIEDDVLLLGGVVGHRGGQLDGAQFPDLAVRRPVNSGVVEYIRVVGKLYCQR